jgi:hypothetical protein
MVLTKQEAEARVQELLAIAKTAIDEVTALAKEHALEPSFMEMTFHHHRERWGDSYRLRDPDWYSDEYWSSSTADCEVDYYSAGAQEDP